MLIVCEGIEKSLISYVSSCRAVPSERPVLIIYFSLTAGAVLPSGPFVDIIIVPRGSLGSGEAPIWIVFS